MLSSFKIARASTSQLAARLLSTRVGDAILRLSNRSALERYLRAEGPHKLHLGCGPRALPGWLNADLPSIRRVIEIRRFKELERPVLSVDAARSLPFDDASFDRIYSEHMHEHLSYSAGLSLLLEVRRVLKPGGRLRLALPDLEFLISTIQSTKTFDEYAIMFADAIHATDGLSGAPLTKNAFLNFLFKGSEHKYLYSRDELTTQLQLAGFRAVTFMQPGESEDPELRGLETNPLGRGEGQLQVHISYTMSVEASR